MGLGAIELHPSDGMEMRRQTDRSVKFWAVSGMLFVLALVYLLATAPPPLVQEELATYSFSTEEALTLMAYENDVTRTLFTKAIVEEGKKQGLEFSESWAQPDVAAGPLPALFLRGVAESLKRSTVPMGLYLGSDFPIESSNRFQGRQAEAFEEMRKDGLPKHFKDPESGDLIGMYPDVASAMACVTCHNDHEKSAKRDWALGDLMGATTWSYPGDSVTTDEFTDMLRAYREGVSDVWNRYLLEVEDMEELQRPDIGAAWPSTGMHLPTAAVFQDSVARLSGAHLLSAMINQEK